MLFFAVEIIFLFLVCFFVRFTNKGRVSSGKSRKSVVEQAGYWSNYSCMRECQRIMQERKNSIE